MRIDGLPPITYTPLAAKTTEPTAASTDSGFGNQIKQALDQVNSLQESANNQALSNSPEDAHKSIIAMERALLAMDFTLQVRNKVLEAYQEIMKTQL